MGGLIFTEVKKSRSIAAAAVRVTRAEIWRIHDAALVDMTGVIEIVENAFMDRG